jgi:serralysin
MCISCGHPGLVHDGSDATPFDSSAGGGASLSNSGLSFAATPPAGSEAEITFLSGVTASNQVAATSFWTWFGNNPATYSSTWSDAAKWGSAIPGTPGNTVTYWFDAASAWTSTERDALGSGLALWSAEANITFSPAATAGSANFIFYRGHNGSAFEQSNYQTTAHVGDGSIGNYFSSGSRISIDTRVPGFGPIGATEFSTYGGYPYQTLVHEIGHLIGLGHGGPYNGSVNSSTQQFSAYDTRLWSLMSYINPWTTSAKYYGSYPVTGTDWRISPDGYFNEPTTPMMLDILAAQRLYGPATSGPLASGGQVFGFNSNIDDSNPHYSIADYFNFNVNRFPVITIWDGRLNNTLDLSGWSTPSTINLNPGTFSSANGAVNNIGIAPGTVIETAIGGGGNDTIIGNSYNNTLNGGNGADTLIGGAGADTLIGGAGTDTADYSSSAAGVTVNLLTNSGANGDAQGDTLSSIENIIGSAFADMLTGNASANTLDGRSGNDTLVGGAGADALIGGAGRDTADYSSSAAGVTVNLLTGSGSGGDAQGDTLSGIENIIGSAFADVLTGDSGANTLVGGAGADALNGGAGADTADYSSSAAGVTVNLLTGSGSGGDAHGDTLSGIENITGSAFADTLTGDGGANTLAGHARHPYRPRRQ